MSEKQLNFLNIFEPSKHEIENIDDGEIENEEVLNNQEVEEKKEDLISESLIKREEEIKKEAERKLKRLNILKAGEDSLTVADFEELMPEIKAYEIRILMLKAVYQNATPGADKEKAYLKIVNPDIHDDEAHRDSARLYLKYLEVCKREEKRRTLQLQSQAKHKKAQPKINKKIKAAEWKKGSGRDRAVAKFE